MKKRKKEKKRKLCEVLRKCTENNSRKDTKKKRECEKRERVC